VCLVHASHFLKLVIALEQVPCFVLLDVSVEFVELSQETLFGFFHQPIVFSLHFGITVFLLREIFAEELFLCIESLVSFIALSTTLVKGILKDSSMAVNLSLILELPVLELGEEFVFSFLEGLEVPFVQLLQFFSMLFHLGC